MDAPFFDFCVELRRRGLRVGVREHRAFLKLLQCWDLTDRDRLRDAAACLLGRGQQEVQLVSDLFDAFFPHVDALQTDQHPALSVAHTPRRWRRWPMIAAFCLFLSSLAVAGILHELAKTLPRPAAADAPADAAAPDDAEFGHHVQAFPPPEYYMPPLPALPWHFRFALANICGATLFSAAWLALFLIRRQYETSNQIRTQLLNRVLTLRGPSEFHIQSFNIEPRLPRDDLEDISALLFRLCSRRTGGLDLDLQATVRATAMRGALTEVKFRTRRQSEQILILLDCSGEMRPFLPRVRAWLCGLQQRGVDLQVCYFNEAWELLGEAGRALSLPTVGSLIQPTLLITTGLILVSEENQQPAWVQKLSRQPRCAIINPIREKALWRTKLRWCDGIFTLSRLGLIRAAARLAHDPSLVSLRLECNEDDAPVLAWSHVHRILQLAALLPSTPVEFVEWLRQRFAPECPDEAVWLAVDYSSDPSGAVLLFPKPFQQALHRELMHSNPQLADLARCGLLEKLVASEPPAQTEAHLRWRLACALLRVCLRDPELRLAAGSAGAIRELHHLQQSPIHDEVIYQLEARELESIKTCKVTDLALTRTNILARAPVDAPTSAASSAGASPRRVYPELGDCVAPGVLAAAVWVGIVLIQLFPRPQHEPLYHVTLRAGTNDNIFLDITSLFDGAPSLVMVYEDEQKTSQRAHIPGSIRVKQSATPRHLHVRAELEDGRIGYSNELTIPALPSTSSPHDLGNGPDLVKDPDSVVKLQPEVNAAEADQTLSNAQTEYVNGNFSQAVAVAKSVQRINPTRAWRIIGAAACNMKDVKLASEAFKHLDSASRQYLVYTCQRQGITNTNGSQFKINEE